MNEEEFWRSEANFNRTIDLLTTEGIDSPVLVKYEEEHPGSLDVYRDHMAEANVSWLNRRAFWMAVEDVFGDDAEIAVSCMFCNPLYEIRTMIILGSYDEAADWIVANEEMMRAFIDKAKTTIGAAGLDPLYESRQYALQNRYMSMFWEFIAEKVDGKN